MALTFHILPRHALVLVRYAGMARVDETARAMEACALHPDFRPTFRHVVDFTHLTGFEPDYPAIMALQARAADWALPPDHGPFLIYLAPTAVAQAMARLVMRSWEGVGQAVVLLFSEEQAVMDYLGLPDRTLASLMVLPDTPG